jgi:hypothetical protein
MDRFGRLSWEDVLRVASSQLLIPQRVALGVAKSPVENVCLIGLVISQ